jgi:predicted GNAT superfamily acetyltransferase
MNDYVQIKFAEKYSIEHDEKMVVALTPWHTVELNRQHAEYIEKVLAEPFEGKTVVFTHHAPLMQSEHPKYKNDTTNFFYCNTNLERLFYDYDFVVWMHGHTHKRQEYMFNGKKVMARPRGYHRYEIMAKVYDDAHMDADVFEI